MAVTGLGQKAGSIAKSGKMNRMLSLAPWRIGLRLLKAGHLQPLGAVTILARDGRLSRCPVRAELSSKAFCRCHRTPKPPKLAMTTRRPQLSAKKDTALQKARTHTTSPGGSNAFVGDT